MCEEDEFLNPVSKFKIYSPNLHSPSIKDKLTSLLPHTDRGKFFFQNILTGVASSMKHSCHRVATAQGKQGI